MRIHRSRPDENFTILPNATLRDQRLSYTARGVLIELLSHSDGWETNADALWRLGQRERGGKTGEGRRAIRTAFAELEECGYMVRRRVQKEKGRFVTEIDLYDTPDRRSATTGMSVHAINGGDRGTGYETSVGETSADETSVTGTSTRSTNVRSTNERRTDEEDSSALANARAGALTSAANFDVKAHAALAWGLVDETQQADVEREAIINGSARDQAPDARARAERASQLQELYNAVDRLSDQDLRNALLKFERQRKRIYRDSRNDAIDQIRGEDASLLKADSASHRIDNLSYKYGLKHYHDEDRGWPAFLIRPLLAGDGRGRVA